VTDAPRVLLIAPQPFFRVTGTPISVLMMCRALTEGGYQVELLTLPQGDDVAMPGLVVRRVPRLPGIADVPVGFSAGKLLYNLVIAGTLLACLWPPRIQLVHAIEEAAFYAVPLARLMGVPGIVDLDSDLAQQLHDHGSRLARLLAAPAARLRRTALRHATAALTVAPRGSEIVRAESPRTPVFEIGDIPIKGAGRRPHPKRMARYRAELGLEGRRLLVYTGNYDRRQGLVELVQAMPAVIRRHPAAALLVVGGEAAGVRALQAEVDRHGLGAAVRLIGPRPPETMAEYMGMAEALVSPRLEPYTTPLKLFSYMASGRPIVATDLPTHTQILDETMAILVPPTAAGLSAGLLRALDDPAAAAVLGERARLRVRRHSFAAFKRRLLRAYGTILARCENPVMVVAR
jgi:glycosyltransferase involved in cell wall biosynthesis